MTQIPIEVSNFFLAMQAGQPGAKALEGHFTDDAVYVEPFTGETRRHEGRAAIMKAMALGWEMPMVETRIEVLGAKLEGDVVQVQWACHSPSIPGGRGSGTNRFTLRGGKIAELVTTLDGGPA
ncbi:nuclear transport factor 2 family protein [Rhodophyticola sp. CCM32]|uniref:nuclear transport factor 2 family protein n=1 Tax=Rhodophyticola sp. CCM32 TaxID=2916397 RepID=UPI00143CC5AF|nr:nuclear transport factor 2 family protein [Rhodophyticola sp. CCM32]